MKAGRVITPCARSLPTGLPISSSSPSKSRMSSIIWNAMPSWREYSLRAATSLSGAPLRMAPASPEVQNRDAVLLYMRL